MTTRAANWVKSYRNGWLWGWQKHATYFVFHLGRIDVLVCWR
jgi:hypothetical protein